MFEAVLFDLGDTLVHFETWRPARFLKAGTQPAYDRLCELGFSPPAFAVYSRAIRRSFIRSFIWSRLRRREVRLADIFHRRHLAMGLPVDREHMTDLIERCISPFRKLFEADPEAIPMLRELQQAGLKLGIVSNTMFPSYAIDDVLLHDGLLEWFPVRVYSSDVGYMKPDRRIFDIAVQRMRIQPSRTLFVGDRVSKDVRGAARVGMKTALVCRNGRSGGGRPRPDYLIRRLAELPAIALGQRVAVRQENACCPAAKAAETLG
jgi:putative hydrolase of the HAD superfamily